MHKSRKTLHIRHSLLTVALFARFDVAGFQDGQFEDVSGLDVTGDDFARSADESAGIPRLPQSDSLGNAAGARREHRRIAGEQIGPSEASPARAGRRGAPAVGRRAVGVQTF